MERIWLVTDADRDADGKIRTLADLLPEAPEETPEEAAEKRERPRTRLPIGKYDLAGIVGGLVLAAALIAGMQMFFPATAPRLPTPTAAPPPTARPTATKAPTQTPTATPEPPTATPEPPPTPEVVYVEVPPACDPMVNPRYSVHIDLSPIGSVTGVSCNSIEEAQSNADRMAAEMRATAEAH